MILSLISLSFEMKDNNAFFLKTDEIKINSNINKGFS